MAKENSKIVTKSFTVLNTTELDKNISETLSSLIQIEREKGREIDLDSVQVSISHSGSKIFVVIISQSKYDSNKQLLN